uniref:(northern house mosquito) hypothetical protein n=1 Tax=Culex pipiens TaxID=7175 RepID=A0A8D8CVN5_CULPI
MIGLASLGVHSFRNTAGYGTIAIATSLGRRKRSSVGLFFRDRLLLLLRNSGMHGLRQQCVVQGHNPQVSLLNQTHHSRPLDVVVEAITSICVTHLELVTNLIELAVIFLDVPHEDLDLGKRRQLVVLLERRQPAHDPRDLPLDEVSLDGQGTR